MQEPTNPGMHGTKQMNHGAIFVYILYCHHPHLPILWLWTHGCAFAADDFPRSWSLQHLQVFGLTNSTGIFIIANIVSLRNINEQLEQNGPLTLWMFSSNHLENILPVVFACTCKKLFVHFSTQIEQEWPPGRLQKNHWILFRCKMTLTSRIYWKSIYSDIPACMHHHASICYRCICLPHLFIYRM